MKSDLDNKSVRQTQSSKLIQNWSDCVFSPGVSRPVYPYVIGVLKGEGIGSEVVDCALQVLSAIETVCNRSFVLKFGGAIGKDAECLWGTPLSQEVIEFCREIFSCGGAILAGAGGSRFVYDLRQKFDLFCKISPVQVVQPLINAGPMKPEHLSSVDMLIIRENISGIYQGKWKEIDCAIAGRKAEHSFCYTESEVLRILEVAANIARQRRNHITVIYKDSGIPTISALWRDCTQEIARSTGVNSSILDIDYSAYRILQNPRDMDVVVAPNLFGDVLSDLAALLLGSRGLAFSGNFATDGAAVYQTNHGAAYDLAGQNRANPVAQILSLAMLLRESFGLIQEANLIERSILEVWQQGWRTEDLAETGCQVLGTRELTDRIVKTILNSKALSV